MRQRRGSLKNPTCPSFFFLTVTFLKHIEFKWRVEGEVGVVAKKIDRDHWSDGSEKEGEEAGM